VLLAVPAVAQPAEQLGSRARVSQVGDVNVLLLTQSLGANDAHISQAGVGHRARLEQTGGSVADIDQEGVGHRLAGFDAFGAPDENAAALQFDGSQLVLKQIGGMNSQAFVDQRDGSIASITQFGSDNAAYLIQSGGINDASVVQGGNATAWITQTGHSNVVDIIQNP
jgi:hypothetical protein